MESFFARVWQIETYTYNELQCSSIRSDPSLAFIAFLFSFWLVFPAVANPTDNIVAAYLLSALFSALLFVGIIGRFLPIRFKRQTGALLFVVLALLLIPADLYIRHINFLDQPLVDPLSVCLATGQIASSIILGLGIATQPRAS